MFVKQTTELSTMTVIVICSAQTASSCIVTGCKLSNLSRSYHQFIEQNDRSATYIDMHEIHVEII